MFTSGDGCRCSGDYSRVGSAGDGIRDGAGLVPTVRARCDRDAVDDYLACGHTGRRGGPALRRLGWWHIRHLEMKKVPIGGQQDEELVVEKQGERREKASVGEGADASGGRCRPGGHCWYKPCPVVVVDGLKLVLMLASTGDSHARRP